MFPSLFNSICHLYFMEPNKAHSYHKEYNNNKSKYHLYLKLMHFSVSPVYWFQFQRLIILNILQVPFWWYGFDILHIMFWDETATCICLYRSVCFTGVFKWLVSSFVVSWSLIFNHMVPNVTLQLGWIWPQQPNVTLLLDSWVKDLEIDICCSLVLNVEPCIGDGGIT